MAATRFEKVCASVRNLAYDDSETTQDDFKVEKEAVLDSLRDLNRRTIAPIDSAYVDLIDCVAENVTRRANIDRRRKAVDKALEKLQQALEKVAARTQKDAQLLALIRSGEAQRVHDAFIVDDNAPIEVGDEDEDEDDEESSDVCDDVYDDDLETDDLDEVEVVGSYTDEDDDADTDDADDDAESDDVEVFDENDDLGKAEVVVDDTEPREKRQRVH